MLFYKLPVKAFLSVEEGRMIHRLCHAAIPEKIEPLKTPDKLEDLTRAYINNESCLQDLPQQTLSTFHCGFLPLRIYTEFGAENVHHAYNKAAKQWGDKKAGDCNLIQYITKEHRLIVNQNECSFNGTTPTFTKVSHSEFTAIIKAWRSAQ